MRDKGLILSASNPAHGNPNKWILKYNSDVMS